MSLSKLNICSYFLSFFRKTMRLSQIFGDNPIPRNGIFSLSDFDFFLYHNFLQKFPKYPIFTYRKDIDISSWFGRGLERKQCPSKATVKEKK